MSTDPWQAIAKAFDLDMQRLRTPERLHQPHHGLGLWACRCDRFYRFVYQLTRASEGANWLNNDRTPAQIFNWWSDLHATSNTPSHASDPAHPQPRQPAHADQEAP